MESTSSSSRGVWFFLSALVLAAALVGAVYLGSSAYLNRQRVNDIIDVTGKGEHEFESDLIVWKASFVKTHQDLPTAYSELNTDKETLESFLEEQGITSEEVVFEAVIIKKQYDYEYANGHEKRIFKGYQLTQNIKVSSNDLDKIEKSSREITSLINRGLEVYSKAPQYFYTQLARLKKRMIEDATEDARIRAEKIAEHSNATLGVLKYAKMGVFQIIGKNSNESFSWGGAYNTSSRWKTASITMKLQYNIGGIGSGVKERKTVGK